MSRPIRREEQGLGEAIEDVDGLEPRLSRKAIKRRKGKGDKPKPPKRHNKDGD